MGKGDHCAVWGCNNDRRYPEKQLILPHVGILRFYSPQGKSDLSKWKKLISRKNFKVTKSTRVCSNHFALGYRCRKSCSYPTMYMKGYGQDIVIGHRRPPPKERGEVTVSGKRKREDEETLQCQKVMKPGADNYVTGTNEFEPINTVREDESELINDCQNIHVGTKEEVVYNFDGDLDPVMVEDKQIDDLDCNQMKSNQTKQNTVTDGSESVNSVKRALFIDQATCPKNCYRYTGLSRPKLDLVFSFVEQKAERIRYWRGSVDTRSSRKQRRNCSRGLTSWEEFVLTLVRTRKGFDVRFLADTFGISHGQVSRIYNTWISFLSPELSFLIPWPSLAEIQGKLPKRFSKFSNTRVIIDCMELYIQKPTLPSCQKITWSNYKHWNTAKLLVGITPCGVISFVSSLWSGSISDKEIFRRSALLHRLEEGDAVMADRGFRIRDLLVMKKAHLISPAYCRGPRLSVKGTTYSRRVAALRSHIERYILKLKLFRILSGVIPLNLKAMLDPIVHVCAALANLGKRSIK